MTCSLWLFRYSTVGICHASQSNWFQLGLNLPTTTMFSFFSTSSPVDPTAPNIHPVSSRYKDEELFGKLDANDTAWLCASGFITETQTFYITTDDGTSITCQVIHSAVGPWPTIQFLCKVYNPATKKKVWKSVNVSNFVTPPPRLDRRSSKADQFSITYKATPDDPESAESYDISTTQAFGSDIQLHLKIKRPASIPGYKIGQGPQGGYSYFGHDPAHAEGYVVHRFWPHFTASGDVILSGKHTSFQGRGMFVHAIQGMRPNLVASSWNFANFQSFEHGGVSAIQMEFKTCKSHGKHGAGSGGVYINIGSLVVGGKLAAVTAETKWPDEEQAEKPVISRATHLNLVLDPDTKYEVPTGVEFQWQGPSLSSPEPLKAKIHVELGDVGHPKGLIEKVDVLAEIPYFVKVAVNYMAGTKPYIYQWINPATLSVTGADALVPGLSTGLEVKGYLYNEATFIS